MRRNPFDIWRVPSRFALVAGVVGLVILVASAGRASADVEASDQLLRIVSLQTLRIPTRAAWLAGVIFLAPLLIELVGGLSYELVRRLRRT